MNNLIQYCIDTGLEKFIRFKFERKSRVVMREHFVSNNDVEKYSLYLYVHKDQYGRYKLLKYVFRKISYICEILSIPETPHLYQPRESDVIWRINDKIAELDKDLLKGIKRERLLKLQELIKKIENEHK